MNLVYSKEDIDKIRPYKEFYDLVVYPKRFPAYIAFHSHDGGLGGDYYTMDILEIPENVKCAESFMAGVNSREKNLKTHTESIFKRKNEKQ